MSNDKKIRYGLGSLEEEIRKVRGLVVEGHDFKTPDGVEVLDEAKNVVKINRKPHERVPEDATLTMVVKNGTVTFNIRYVAGGGENGVSIKDLAKKIGAT
jgi:hypothetical protein